MQNLLAKWATSPPWVKQFMAVVVAAGVGVGGYCYGRYSGHTEVEVTDSGRNDADGKLISQTGPKGDYSNRPVAYIYDNVPVTREDLGEYLIARFGNERAEFLVNKRIVEMACKAKGIEISDAQVLAQLEADVKSFGQHMTVKDFTEQVLRRFNKSLFEWKEDVIRPKLAMSELVRKSVTVTDGDIQKAFEAKYGPKVQCRMIVLPKDALHPTKTYQEITKNEENFRKAAREQLVPELRDRGGEVPPIFKHFPDEKIEKEAFSLKEGQFSSLLTMQDGSFVILRCDKHLPKDELHRIETEKAALTSEIFERKVAMKIPEVFQQMREKARPRLFLPNPNQPGAQQGTQQVSSVQAPPPSGQGPSIPPPVTTPRKDPAPLVPIGN